MKMTPWICLACALALANAPASNAATLTPAWFDGYDVSQAGGTTAGFSSFNINEEIGPPRQGGPLVPTAYVTNTADPSNDFRHQLFPPSNGSQPLQLAGDAFLAGAPTLASPNQDFSGPFGGDVLGKRVSFSLDVASFNSGDPNNSFINFGVTLGAASPLVIPDSNVGAPNDKFGVLFIEDTFGGNGAFLQFFDGAGNLVQNLVAHPAGFGPMNVQIDIDDPVDGNPWDGIGSTVFEVSIDGTPVGAPQVFGGGGMTNNILTLSANRDFASQGLVTHAVDNLTVFSGPPIPEPTTACLLGLAVLTAAWRRR